VNGVGGEVVRVVGIAMVDCFLAGEARERARYGLWWTRRRRREHAEQLHMAAFARLGEVQALLGVCDEPPD
jgi:hypothetical protein